MNNDNEVMNQMIGTRYKMKLEWLSNTLRRTSAILIVGWNSEVSEVRGKKTAFADIQKYMLLLRHYARIRQHYLTVSLFFLLFETNWQVCKLHSSI